MIEPITPELFNHLVQLAALQLNKNEADYLLEQLNNQLKAIEELQSIPVDSDTPLAEHGIPYSPEISPAIRQDEWEMDTDPEEILDQAPELQDGYILVPDIPHMTL
jgi:aspartyl-tRNA(Asn)/glutamyl-tRNA(Gln) amidotransferase subunit C